MQTIELPEPVIKEKDRSINARYKTGITKKEEYSDRVKDILFTLGVSYTKAGINYFSGERTTTDYYAVTVINETLEGGMIGFIVGSGGGITRIPQPSNRFSRKKLREIFEEYREKVEGWLSLPDEEAAMHLDEKEFALREKIRPYWNGEKAGLA